MPIYDRSHEDSFDPARHSRWVMRWRDGDGKQRKRTFATKAEAQAFERDTLTSRELRDQTRTVAEQWERWKDSRRSTGTGHQRNITSTWDSHLRDQWGHRRVAGIDHSEVSAWAGRTTTTHTPSIARTALVQLASILDQAVRDNVIAANPCDGITIRVTRTHEPVFLSREMLDTVATAMGPDRLAVLTLGLTGIRWGELVGLQNRDLDTARKRISLQRTVTEVGGRLEVKPGTKNRGTREVTAPAWLLTELEAQRTGRPTDPLLPAPEGGLRRHSQFHHRWSARVQGPNDPPKPTRGPTPAPGLGLDMRIHDLRHTAASLMIASGADVKTVQRQLGHRSATMTLDLYGHLWDSALDDLSDRMK